MQKKELVDLENYFKELQDYIDYLKYYLTNIKSTDKNFKFAKIIIHNIDELIKYKFNLIRKKIKEEIDEEQKNIRFEKITKINSPDKKGVERIAKLLKIKTSLLDRIKEG